MKFLAATLFLASIPAAQHPGGAPPLWTAYTNNAQSIEISQPFVTMVPQINGQTPITYSVAPNYTLPNWLTLNPTNGQISQTGTPSPLGAWSSRIKAQNNNGQSQINISGTVRRDRVDFGMNVNFLNYYSRAHFFPNLMVQANSWKEGLGTGSGTPDVPLLTSGIGAGYPNFAAGNPQTAYAAVGNEQIDTDGNCALPLGRYRLEWDGVTNAGGSVSLQINNEQTPSQLTETSCGTNCKEYTNFVPRSVWVKIVNGSTGSNPVRNIRVWMPNTELGPPHNTAYDSSAPLVRPSLVDFFEDVTHANDLARGPIRFMDWCRVNECGVTGNWSVGSTFDGTRLTLQSPSQANTWSNTSDGLPVREPPVAYEYMIEICNQAGTDLWVNLPHQEADDPGMNYGAYCEGLADLILNGRPSATPPSPALNSNLNVYVEWSNEVWNDGFRCRNWIEQQAGSTDIYSTTFQDFQIARMLEMYSFMKKKFNDAGQGNRLRFVVMGWLNGSNYLDGLLEGLEGRAPTFQPPTIPPPLGGTFDIATDLYGAGCSFYFRKPTNDNQWPGGTEPDQMIDQIMTYVTGAFTTGLEAHKTIVKDRGLKFILYEGGVSVPGTLPQAWRQNWYRANKNATALYPSSFTFEDYGMYDMYRTVISLLRDKQVDIACHYAFLFKLDDSAGVWQLKENESQVPSSPFNTGFVPKLDAWIEGPLPGLDQ